MLTSVEVPEVCVTLTRKRNAPKVASLNVSGSVTQMKQASFVHEFLNLVRIRLISCL